MSTALILGAGFSCAAGLPLTKDLFTELPKCKPGKDEHRMIAIRIAFEKWREKVEDGSPELWMREIYSKHTDPARSAATDPNWDDLVQYVTRRVSRAKNADAGPYYYGITRHDIPAGHRAFWKTIDSIAPKFSVVTLNYDILVERALHRTTIQGGLSPRFFYGGFPYNMRVNKITRLQHPTQSAEIRLGDEIGVYKLHGSLNWAREPHSPLMKMHDDVRAAYRRVGTPQIVPPITEKKMPPEFGAIWTEAEIVLANSDTWIVFGYSMPAYDVAVSSLMARSAQAGVPKTIQIINPDKETMSRWSALPGCAASCWYASTDDWISAAQVALRGR